MANETKSLTLSKKTATVIARVGAHVVAPATIGAAVVGGTRALIKGKNEAGAYQLSTGWMIGGAIAGVAVNAGIQLGAEALEQAAVEKAKKADGAKIEAQA